jgi:hypothetical protein
MMSARSFRFKKSLISYRRRVARVARASKKLKQPWLLRHSSKRLQTVVARGLHTQRETKVMELALLPNATVVSRLLMHSIVPVAARIVMALTVKAVVALSTQKQWRVPESECLPHWKRGLRLAIEARPPLSQLMTLTCNSLQSS